jgi:glyoxylase-like metal-dependent hydrolase (beta-lactamase superfamily II)
MKPECYQFKVGTFECIAVNDGDSVYENPGPTLFVNAPQDRLAQILREHDIELERWNEWVSPYTCLLVKTESHYVLVDSGKGSAFPPAVGHLIQHLQTFAVRPDEIDTVLLTHAHGDHTGGNTDPEGRAAFPQARYIMWKAEWDFWTSETVLAQPPYAWMAPVVHTNLLPLYDRFELIEQDREIVPGIQAIGAPGHTPGHMVVRVSSGGEDLWYMSDAFLHPVHVEQSDWYSEFDIRPEQAVSTRRRLLDRIAAKQPRILAFHFPFPGLGHVRRHKEGWQWQPILIG